MNDRIKQAETRQFRVIRPALLNDHGILFGGIALQWLDEVAYITATRFTKKTLVTVSVDKVNFLLPVYSGMFVEIVGKVRKVGNVKIEILVELYIEEQNPENQKESTECHLYFCRS